MMVRSVVVLPAPFRPTRQTTSRSRTSSDTRLRMWLAWTNPSIPRTLSIRDLPPPPALSPVGRGFRVTPPQWGGGFRMPSPLWGEGRVGGAPPADDHVHHAGVG